MIEHGEAPSPISTHKPKPQKQPNRKQRKPKNRKKHRNKKRWEATSALYSGLLPLTEAEIISRQIIRDMQDARRSKPDKHQPK